MQLSFQCLSCLSPAVNLALAQMQASRARRRWTAATFGSRLRRRRFENPSTILGADLALVTVLLSSEAPASGPQRRGHAWAPCAKLQWFPGGPRQERSAEPIVVQCKKVIESARGCSDSPEEEQPPAPGSAFLTGTAASVPQLTCRMTIVYRHCGPTRLSKNGDNTQDGSRMEEAGRADGRQRTAAPAGNPGAPISCDGC
jgi:hypothetical protein